MSKVANCVADRLSSYQRIAVWGAGGLGRTALLHWLPREKVVIVTDGNSNVIGRELPSGHRVVTPDALDAATYDAVVICTSVHLEVRDELRRRGSKLPVHYIYELFIPASGVTNELQALTIDIAATKTQVWPLYLMTRPQVMVNITFRLTNWLALRWQLAPLYWIMWFLHHVACLLTSIQLPPGTSVGPGLIFAHYGTIVFTKRAKIGAFFTIYHGCTVGTNDSGEGPVIGDFVSQYAGSHVLGRCRIADHTRIGANAVLLNLETRPSSTVVGIPARITKRSE